MPECSHVDRSLFFPFRGIPARLWYNQEKAAGGSRRTFLGCLMRAGNPHQTLRPVESYHVLRMRIISAMASISWIRANSGFIFSSILMLSHPLSGVEIPQGEQPLRCFGAFPYHKDNTQSHAAAHIRRGARANLHSTSTLPQSSGCV